MPTPNPTTRREFKGAAAGTSLTSPMGNADTSFVIVSNTNWPTGSVGNFIVCINRGQPDEEKILCATQAAKTVTVATSGRGFDGTTAQAHAAGATVECVISAFDADEWNQHTNATTAVHGVTGAVVGTTDTQTLTNKTLNGAVLDAASTIGGVSGTTLSAATSAWLSYTPTLTNFAGSVLYAKYRQTGKTVDVQVSVQLSGAPTSTMFVSIPVNRLTAIAHVVGAAGASHASAVTPGVVLTDNTDATRVYFSNASGAWGATVPVGWVNTDVLTFSASYESV